MHKIKFCISDVESFNIQVYNESVPANETNYLCKYFPVPNDQNYDIIGAEILLDNKKVLHHMVLYGCDVEGKAKKGIVVN